MMNPMPKEYFTGSLFGKGNEPEQGYRPAGDGKFEDPQGNTVNENGELVSEVPDPYFAAALKIIKEIPRYRNEPASYIKSLAQAEAARMRAEAKKQTKEKGAKKRQIKN